VAGRSTRSLDCIVTKKQRRIVYTWVTGIACFGLAAAVDLAGHDTWVKPILLLGIVPMLTFDSPDRAIHERWQRVARAHPFLTWWLAVCTLAIVAGAIVSANSSLRVIHTLGFGGIIIVLAVAFGPLLAFVEWDKFKSAAAASNDAI